MTWIGQFFIITYYRPPCVPGQYMSTTCAWYEARWARGTSRSSAELCWTPHLVRCGTPYADPARRGWIRFACSPGTGQGTRYVPTVTHPRRVRDCRDSSTWLSWHFVTAVTRPAVTHPHPSRAQGFLVRQWRAPTLALRQAGTYTNRTLLAVHKCRWVYLSTWVYLRPLRNYFLKGMCTILC